MLFSKLLEKLRTEYSIETISAKEQTNICDVVLIDQKRKSFADSILYLGYDSQLQHTSKIPNQCILTHSLNSPKITQSNFNLAYTDDCSLFSIFNEVKSLLEKDISKTLYQDLIDIADKTHNLNSVIDLASINLGQSILLCDTTFKIITSSTSIPVSDHVWSKNIKQGYCSYDFISAVKALPNIKNVSKSTETLEVTCIASPNRKLTRKVFFNKKQVGFILMIEGEKKFSQSNEELLSIVSDAIEYTIKNYIANLAEIITPHYSLMYDFIIGAPIEDIKPKLDKILFPSLMTVLYLCNKNDFDNWYRRNETASKLSLLFPGTHLTYNNKGIVAVIPTNLSNPTDNYTNKLLKFAESENVYIGISYDFSDICMLYKHYQQAYKALSLGEIFEPDKKYYFYKDFQAYDLISRADDKSSLPNLISPTLLILKSYDKKNKTQLLNTLHTYIDNDCCAKETAASLFIHRNSLSYRLNKIVELTNIDFEDHQSKFLLKLSFLINDYCMKTSNYLL